MSETPTAFIEAEGTRSTPMSGYSNKDLINRIQILRFEKCIEDMYKDRGEFRYSLTQLFWSYIVPRLGSIESPKQKEKLVGLYLTLNEKTKPEEEQKKLFRIFEEIAQFMYESGALKTEYANVDPYHALIKRLQDRKQVIK